MDDLKKITEIIESAGFSHTERIHMETVELMDEVREMCQNGNCGMYGKNWACPPGCGSLEDCRKKPFPIPKRNSCTNCRRTGRQYGLGRY